MASSVLLEEFQRIRTPPGLRRISETGHEPAIQMLILPLFSSERVEARLDEIGRPDDNLLHIDTNLRYGCTILRYYYDKEKGDLRRALGRYNGSLGKRKYPNKVIDKLSKKWFQA